LRYAFYHACLPVELMPEMNFNDLTLDSNNNPKQSFFNFFNAFIINQRYGIAFPKMRVLCLLILYVFLNIFQVKMFVCCCFIV